MKKQTTLLLIFTMSILAQQKVIGQVNWGSFNTVLQQLSQAERNTYFNNLDRLNRDFDPRALDLNIPMQGLNNALESGNPAAGLSGFSSEWQGAGILLNNGLGNSGLNNEDKGVLLNGFHQLEYIWQKTYKDIKRTGNGHLDDGYRTPLLPSRINQRDYKLWSSAQDILQKDLRINSTYEPAKGLGNFKSLFKELFNPSLFTDIEFYGGAQNANVQYYTQHYGKSLPVVGIGTVEQFNTTCEARWRGSVSFERNQSSNNDNNNNEALNSAQQTPGFNPLLLYGEFSMMFNPLLINSNLSRSTLRLISSLGIDVGTYAPDHRTPQKPNNKGFATGCGPKLGAGFAVRLGLITSYAMGSLAYGEVNCPGMVNDSYRSYGLEAGIKYLNRFTVRYEMRNTDWTNGLNSRIKNARSNQITIGIPITNLLQSFN
jgi:hypothetical protein